MQTIRADVADLLGQGVWAITESRRLRVRARNLTREARKVSQRPRALMECIMVTRELRDDVERRRLRAVVRALRRRQPPRYRIGASEKAEQRSQNAYGRD